MNKLFLVLSLVFVVLLTGCGLIPSENKTYLSEETIQTVNSLQKKEDIIKTLGKPAKEITDSKKLTKNLNTTLKLLEPQKDEAFNKQDNQTIDELSNITDYCNDLLKKITEHEKVECLIYYWKTNDGSEMKKYIYMHNDILQFTINQ